MQRILFWDDKLIEKNEGISIIQHKPEKKNIALYCDELYEGAHNGYACVMKVGEKYRFYYRAMAWAHSLDSRIKINWETYKECICVAESYDGIHFKKPIVGNYDYNGTKENNIVYLKEDGMMDNFSIFYDENPNCPADEKFKALSSVYFNGLRNNLEYFASADGYTFRSMGILPLHGMFDTYNVTFWDKKTQRYFIYYRNFHKADGSEFNEDEKISDVSDIRDVRVATSTDFKNWAEHGRIAFEEGQPDTPLYTNQITKYFRDENVFLGFPTRYDDREKDIENFKFFPHADRRKLVQEKFGREGRVVNDCLIMTSNDGFTFNRRDDAFLSPGIETRYNWEYGNCYPAYGLVETEAEDGAPNEISFYMGENYRTKNVHFRRYTMRLDGFFSWYGKNCGGEIITKPVVIDGENMFVNFSSSAHGGLQIALLDEDDNVIDGYESYVIFGDTINRPVEFEKPLSNLYGKKVKMRIKLQDCHLYSLTIE